MSYSIEEHKHRFAAWAAVRAANVNGCRFTVEQGKDILEKAGMNRVAKSLDSFQNQKNSIKNMKNGEITSLLPPNLMI